LIVIFVKWSYL